MGSRGPSHDEEHTAEPPAWEQTELPRPPAPSSVDVPSRPTEGLLGDTGLRRDPPNPTGGQPQRYTPVSVHGRPVWSGNPQRLVIPETSQAFEWGFCVPPPIAWGVAISERPPFLR